MEELDTERINDISDAHRLRLIYEVLTDTTENGGIDLLGSTPWESVYCDVFARHDEAFNQVGFCNR